MIGRQGMSHQWLIALGLLLVITLFAGLLGADFDVARSDGGSLALQPIPVDGVPPRLSEDLGALLVSGDADRENAARLHVVLPASKPEDARWVIWMSRNPVDAVELQRGDWHSGPRSFFHPEATEGLFPSGYAFALPSSWQGPIDIDLHARSEVRSLLRPRLMRSDAATRLERQGSAITAMLYASLLTLAVLALALFSAARDRMFFAFFCHAVITLLMLATLNGHLYQLRWLGAFSGWGVSGLLAVGLLYSASLLQILAQYCDVRAIRPRTARAVDVVCAIFGVLAATCLLGLPALSKPLQWLAALCWMGTCLGALALLVDASRRGVHFARWLAALSLFGALGSLLVELVMRGYQLDVGWSRYGYQVSVVALAMMLAVGLVSRISEFRDQRDRERLARADADRRMQREAARSDLNAGLQITLRNCKEDEIEWVALRMLLDRLAPQLAAGEASVLVEGYHGLDLLLAYPAQDATALRERVMARRLALKRLASQAMMLQQPQGGLDGAAAVSMIEAVVPLQVPAPAWGVLLLARDGGEGFTTEEMAMASECARLTLTHIDQAKASISLRRSAELDALTGTFNRRTIDLWTARSFDEAVRDGQPLSVLFVDLDYFKAINDKYGHACGDQCLREVAATIRGAFGQGELIGRYGGEEFIVVLPGHGGAVARTVGERLRLAIESLGVNWEGQVLRLTVSVGVATRLDSETRAAQTVDRADKALYAAKRSGRNRVQVAPAVFS